MREVDKGQQPLLMQNGFAFPEPAPFEPPKEELKLQQLPAQRQAFRSVTLVKAVTVLTWWSLFDYRGIVDSIELHQQTGATRTAVPMSHWL